MPYRRRTVVLSSLLAASASAHVLAQTHHVAPPEKVTRAVAVFEWTGDLGKPASSRLVPVSLFINGHFEDAGLYLAHPVPFALEPGDIYSVEQAGQEKGTLAIEHARDFTTGRLLADVDPTGAWYGFGRFAPLTPPKKAPALHPSTNLSTIASNADSSRPHLATKNSDSTPAAPASTGTNSTGTTSTGTTGKTPDSATDTTASTKTPMGDDPDRPTLGRRQSGSDTSSDSGSPSTASSTPSTGTDSGSSTGKDPERPSLRKRSPENTGKKSPPQSGVTGPDRSLNDDPDRPTMRHGKAPAEAEAEELKGTPAAMHQVAAVSDAARHDPHAFTREWESPAERTDILTHLQALARAQATAYLTQNHLTAGTPMVPASSTTASTGQAPGSPASGSPDSASDKAAPTLRRTPGGINTSTQPAATPASTTPSTPTQTKKPATTVSRTAAQSRSAKARKPASPPPAPLVLTAEQLTGYTLSYGGLPTFVYTAEVPVKEGGPVYITVVAQRLPSGELQISLHSITDATHLDRTPWMRLVDAVDPDWSHRASLLFELRAQSTRQFAFYRLISAQAEQQFLSSPIAN